MKILFLLTLVLAIVLCMLLNLWELNCLLFIVCFVMVMMVKVVVLWLL